MHQLAEVRLNALDRRVPSIGGALTVFVGSVPLLPAASKLIVLWATPLSLIWLIRTTINHARSFEDAIRRIEQIELAINATASTNLMRFQSHHPSRGRYPGGRTAAETILAVLLGSLALLAVCAFLAVEQVGRDAAVVWSFFAYNAAVSAYMLFLVRIWRSYRYSEPSLEPPPTLDAP